MDIINADYKITDHIHIAGEHFCLGENPASPAPYVVWLTNEDLTYFQWGHYFAHKEAAMADMVQRATYRLEREDGTPLAVDFLAENAREAVEMAYINQKAREAIEYALEDVLRYDIPGASDIKAEEVMKNPEFLALADHRYHNLDHSEEHYALRSALETLLTDNPQFLGELKTAKEPVPLHGEIKISPESHELIKDLLSMSVSEVVEKYGPLGDNFTFDFALADGSSVCLEVVPPYDDPYNEHQINKAAPHFVLWTWTDADGHFLDLQKLSAAELQETGLARTFEIDTDPPVSVAIIEDETLRRTGNAFVFQPDFVGPPAPAEEIYQKHAGEVCAVIRALTPQECDILQTGLMWEAQFPNGDRLHVFDRELTDPRPNPVKTPLNQQITGAQDRTPAAPPRAGEKGIRK